MGPGGGLAEPAPAVRVQGLIKAYGGRRVVDGLSFEVRPGEVFALLGPNGAGKTTTIEILEGFRSADAGQVRVLGLDPARQVTALRQRMGLMLQQGGLFPQITPREALRLFADLHADPEDPDALLQRLGLEALAGTRFRRLSGGQKQRLALGLAIVGKPHIVFLDEPTAAMDPQARHATWDVIRELRQKGCTVLLTTHFMEEAESLADRVGIVDRGRLVALDTPRGLRATTQPRLRFASSPPVQPVAVAAALGLDAGTVSVDERGLVTIGTAPSPALVVRLAAWLAEQGSLVTELHAGTESLEQVYLELTGTAERS